MEHIKNFLALTVHSLLVAASLKCGTDRVRLPLTNPGWCDKEHTSVNHLICTRIASRDTSRDLGSTSVSAT
jgi:hypothetical protein